MVEQQLFSHAYFGPVQYFAHLSRGNGFIERHGNYSRQSYRNRCVIAGANEPLTLSVPVEKGRSHHIPDKDVKIAYHSNWQKQHWRSIVSAYNASPFFQYYRDEVYPFFITKTTFLFDLNMAITRLMMELTGIEGEISFTGEYLSPAGSNIVDLRELIHPKRPASRWDPSFLPIPYKQVFDQRHGFIPNLSILDLLFNKGPEAVLVLEQSVDRELKGERGKVKGERGKVKGERGKVKGLKIKNL